MKLLFKNRLKTVREKHGLIPESSDRYRDMLFWDNRSDIVIPIHEDTFVNIRSIVERSTANDKNDWLLDDVGLTGWAGYVMGYPENNNQDVQLELPITKPLGDLNIIEVIFDWDYKTLTIITSNKHGDETTFGLPESIGNWLWSVFYNGGIKPITEEGLIDIFKQLKFLLQEHKSC